jgi:hypothetical protein
MSDDEKMPNTDEKTPDADETITNKEKAIENYDVGYGRPPKNTQFRKGVSGNPKGCPKRAPDFDAALLREAKSRIAITENGRRIRVSKHDIIVKQFVNNATKGKSSDLRMFREAYRQACEKAAPSVAANPLSGKRPEDLTDEQLAAIIFAELEKQKKE